MYAFLYIIYTCARVAFLASGGSLEAACTRGRERRTLSLRVVGGKVKDRLFSRATPAAVHTHSPSVRAEARRSRPLFHVRAGGVDIYVYIVCVSRQSRRCGSLIFRVCRPARYERNADTHTPTHTLYIYVCVHNHGFSSPYI